MTSNMIVTESESLKISVQIQLRVLNKIYFLNLASIVVRNS